jgi:hypothetical protein
MGSNRSVVPADELHEELVIAFARIRPAECRSCSIPKPHFMPRSDDRVPNWELPFNAGKCKHGCEDLVLWLKRQYGALYDMEEPT